MMRRFSALWVGLGGCLLMAGGLGGCQSRVERVETLSPKGAEAAASLPDLSLTDETQDLLLTWLGDDGDFHVSENVSDVPPDRRERVRVVITTSPVGTGAIVYVANLTNKLESGRYPVGVMPRSEWEKLGAELRKTTMEGLAATTQQAKLSDVDTPEAHATSSDGAKKKGSAATQVTAVIYGADWCKPCHDAERYLKSLGVQVTKKNIETSRAAQAEMQDKLARINRGGASIPVIDVMGRIFVGYSQGALQRAVESAKSGLPVGRRG